MKSPQVVRTRIASGNMAKKSPARSRSKLNSKGKENMGISNVSSKVTKSKDTKVRPVPDFGKLHKKWESQLNVNKAQAKKPLTVVQEFGFTKPCMKKEYVQQKQLNTQKTEMSHKKPHSKEQGFKSDKAALNSIISNKGVSLQRENKSRNTLATVNLNKVENASPEEQQEALPDCQRDSFGTLANIQHEAGIDFEEDQGALQSILDSTGIADCDLKNKNLASVVNNAARQTIDCGGFKAPLAMTPRQVPQVRRSIYYTGPTGKEFSKQFVYSEFARRMASRLTLDSNAPKPLEKPVASPAPKVVQQRNSIYVKVDYGNKPRLPLSPSREIRADPKTPMSERKAQRIINTTPSKGHATRVLSKSTSKKNIMKNWADLLGPKSPAVKDRVQIKLFQDDENCLDENQPLAEKLDEDTQRLKEIKEVEKKLQREIEQMESSKKQAKEQVIVIDKNSPAYNRPAPSTPSRENTKPTARAASDSSVATNGQAVSPRIMGQRRMVLGELNDQDVFERSSPSYRERGRSRNKVKSAPTFASCVFGEQTKSKKVHFETPNVLKHPESPSARYHKNSSSLGSMSLESPNASRVSALKRHGRYSPMGRSPKARDYSPTSRLRDNQVYTIMMEIDKENRSPIRPTLVAKKPNVVITPSKKTIITEEKDEFIVEYDILEQSIQDMSIQDLNHTISESVVAMEGLQNEAESLMEQTNMDETNADNLLEQLELIQKKQQELQMIQKTLQQRLEQRKKKKRLNFDKQQIGSNECQVSKKLVQGIKNKKQEAEVTQKPNTTNVSKKDVLQKKKQLSERNVVDVSPISVGPLSNGNGFSNGFGSNIFLTPENQNTNESDYENSPTLFPVNKNRSLRQPLHSTAHESQHHTKLESTTEMFVSPIKDKLSQGGVLSQGLLQMAQSLNATQHKNLHWKKQLLTSKEDAGCQENNELGSNCEQIPEDSFYENGDSAKTPPTDIGQQTPVRTMQPIGTPFSFCNTLTPKVINTPRSGRKTPISYSPKALFSGSAQLLVNSPIRTPLALREAVSGNNSSKEASPVSKEEISIDASPDSVVEGRGKLSSPIVIRKENVILSSLQSNTGSLSLSANLTGKGSPTAFRIVPRCKPLCSDLQGSLLSKVKVKYMDALLDDEVALYTSRLQLASKYSFGIRCSNPVTKILEEGDEFHFIPIIEPIRSPPRFVPSIGSAFSASSAFRQIRL